MPPLNVIRTISRKQLADVLRVAPPGTYCTQGEAARALGVSRTHLRRLHASGELVPSFVCEDGGALYGVAEVGALGAKRSREPKRPRARGAARVGALALELQRAGHDWRELVARTGVDPAHARAMWRELAAPGDVVLPRVVVEQLAAFGAADEAGHVTPRSVLRCVTTLRAKLRALRG